MKHIDLLRHGKAVSPRGRDDHERELAPQGARDAHHMGEWMAARGPLPERVLVSSARRTRETFERWCMGARWDGTPEFDEDLYLASSLEISKRIAALDDRLDRVMIIGHNPGLEMIVRELTGASIMMATSTVSSMTSDVNSWHFAVGRETCELLETYTPDRS